MSNPTLKQLTSKLKQLPDTLLEEVELYVDFLTFKHKKDSGIIENIPQWHKELVLKRIKEAKKPVDAFDMLNEIDDE